MNQWLPDVDAKPFFENLDRTAPTKRKLPERTPLQKLRMRLARLIWPSNIGWDDV